MYVYLCAALCVGVWGEECGQTLFTRTPCMNVCALGVFIHGIHTYIHTYICTYIRLCLCLTVSVSVCLLSLCVCVCMVRTVLVLFMRRRAGVRAFVVLSVFVVAFLLLLFFCCCCLLLLFCFLFVFFSFFQRSDTHWMDAERPGRESAV